MQQQSDNRGISWWMRVAEAKQEERDAALSDNATLREKLNEAISYTETVDALLDGIIPTRRDSKDPTSGPLWLKDRVQLLIDQNEATADKLSDCWLLLDAIARNDLSMDKARQIAAAVLTKQQCPGWKEGER